MIRHFDHRALALLVSALFAVAICGCDSDGDLPRRCEPAPLALHPEGLLVTDTCGEVLGYLHPWVLVEDQWLGGGAQGPCWVEGNRLGCPAGDLGEAVVRLEDGDVRVELEATADATVQGLALRGEVRVPGATGWLSHGFQSWSQSGVVAIGEPVSPESLKAALTERGDAETLRTGRELAWFHTWIGGTRPGVGSTLFAGALTADRFKPWLMVSQAAGGLLGDVELWLVVGGTGEAVPVTPGETLAGEPWRIRAGNTLQEVLLDFGDDLPSRRRHAPVHVEAGWNSWYELWDGVDEEAVRANAVLARELLEPLLPPGTPLRITVDDGWQEAWGDWAPNPKFPAGMDGLASDLRSDGFQVGVWLAPLLASEGSGIFAAHPEWFVADASYNHSVHGRMFVLDPTHPGAAAHLTGVIARIVGWGYDFLKIDFLFAGAWEGQRHEAVTGQEAYHLALSIIREAAGDDVVLLAVGAPGLPSFPHVDAWRVGPDIAFEPLGASWHFAVNQARTIASRWPLCRATLCDPDPPLLRVLDRAEVDYGGWVVAFAGGGLFLSDDLRALPTERWTWGLDGPRVTASLGGLPAVPLDPFPQSPPAWLVSHALDHLAGENSHVLPELWRLPDGRRVALNHQDQPLRVQGTTIPARGAGLVP